MRNSLFESKYADDTQVADYLSWRQRQMQNPKFKDLSPIQQTHHLSLSGTAAATILSVNPYEKLDDLIARINWEIPEKKTTFAMTRGIALEDPVRKFAVEKLHLTNVRVDVQFDHPVDPERADETWSTCQIDTIAADPNGRDVIVEIKTAGRNLKTKGRRWGKGCLINPAGVVMQTDSEIPTNYLMQVQKQLDVSNLELAYVAVMIDGDKEPRIFCIPRDRHIGDEIAKREVEVLFNFIIPNKHPVTEARPETENDEPIEDVVSWEEFTQNKKLHDLHKQYLALKHEKEEVEDLLANVSLELRKAMGGKHSVINAKGQPFISYSTYTRNSLDTAGIKAHEPELYAKYLKTMKCERITIKEY